MKTGSSHQAVRSVLFFVAVFFLVIGMAGRKISSCEQATAVMVRHVRGAIRERNLGPDLQRYLAYLNGRMDASAGTNTFSDKTGNCRLKWVDRLLRDPLQAPVEAERFSRQMHTALGSRHDSVRRAVTLAFEKLDAPPVFLSPTAKRFDGRELEILTGTVQRICSVWGEVWRAIPEQERSPFLAQIIRQALGENELGHRFADVKEGREVTDRLERLDLRAFSLAALETAALADRFIEGGFDPWLEQWMNRPATTQVEGVEGPVLACWETPFGLVVMGGPESNVYRLDQNPALSVILETGGDNRYEEGTVGFHRPFLLVYDRMGNDVYTGSRTGIQGGAVGGISLLVDRAGDDLYEATDLAQGSALAGIGILVDLAGHDRYRADRRAQGHAVGGMGLLLDRAGEDAYHGAMLVQGVGGPLGIGILADGEGNDRYFSGGKYPGGYDDSPGFGGWSQGVGVGPRGVANGGIGLLLDGGGDDAYEYDYFSHGGGYWFAVGIARDFAGNDQRKGSGSINWDGTPRTVQPFVRWGPAYGCHYAAGFVFDDCGDDLYTGTTAGPCFAWDLALAVLCDAAGDDVYRGGGLGQAAQGGITMLFDGAGSDQYRGGNRIGWAHPSIAYHPELATNANFSFVFDLGGEWDQWDGKLSNNACHVRGWEGGVLKDL